MANEAVCIETPTKFARRKVADGAGIAIGTILKLSDPNTAEASSAEDDAFAGIAWEEKTANDGIIEIVVALNGVWDVLTDTGTDNAGVIGQIVGANTIGTADADSLLNGSACCKFEETAGNAEVARVRFLGY
jgi:hypothetical protein